MAKFRLFGIPVQIDPWFLLGLFFVFQISGGGRPGAFAAVAIGVLTLVHELGHALAARHYGCAVSIRLNLFVGWASYSSTKPLNRREQVMISLLGPMSQLGLGIAGMTLVHRLFAAATFDRSMLFDLWRGLAWAGVIIALLNLLPLWPLDGGHIVHHVLSRFFPERTALRVVLWISVVAMSTLVVTSILAQDASSWLGMQRYSGPDQALQAILDRSTLDALWTQIRTFPSFLLTLPWFLLIFCGMATAQGFSQLRPARPLPAVAIDPELAETTVVTAETRGWDDARLPDLPPGWSSSPWLRAHVAAVRGDERGVQAALAQVVAGGRRWVLPDPARRELAPLVARLGDAPPIGERAPSLVLLRVLGHHAPPALMLQYASALYDRFGTTEPLVTAAAALVRQGHPDDAMRWLDRAMREAPDLRRLTSEPAFMPLHDRDDYRRLVAEVGSRL